jgi:hypothetical protein
MRIYKIRKCLVNKILCYKYNIEETEDDLGPHIQKYYQNKFVQK